MSKLSLLLPLFGLLGCAAPAADGPAASTGDCDAAPAQELIGQAASSDVAQRAQKLSGARTVRWLQPGQIVTMEFRADRLNLVLDDQNKVTAVRCG